MKSQKEINHSRMNKPICLKGAGMIDFVPWVFNHLYHSAFYRNRCVWSTEETPQYPAYRSR